MKTGVEALRGIKYKLRMMGVPLTGPTYVYGLSHRTSLGDVTKDIPPNVPDPRGKAVDLRMWVDSDHAGDKMTRRLRTGYFIFLNTALIDWLNKKQATIEGSVFGA